MNIEFIKWLEQQKYKYASINGMICTWKDVISFSHYKVQKYRSPGEYEYISPRWGVTNE